MYLRQSTARRVTFGPAQTKNASLEESLTFATTDLQISKNGGALSTRNIAKGGYHDNRAIYWATLDATDTNTAGELELYAYDNAGTSLYCQKRWFVVPRERYDQLYASTDYLQTDIRQIGGSAVQHTTGTVHAYNNSGQVISTLDRTAVRQAVSSTLDRNAVLSTLINDGTRLDGSRLNTCASFDRDGLRLSIFTNNRRANLSVGGTIDATSQASSATSTLDRSKIRDALLTDATKFAGAYIDAAISTRSTLDYNGVRIAVSSTLDRSAVLSTLINDGIRLDGSRLNTCASFDRGGVRDAILTDGNRFAGANIDTTISSRATLDRNAVRDAVGSTIDRNALLTTLINDGTRLDGSRLNTCSTLDRAGISSSVASTADRDSIRTAVWSDGTNIAGASVDYAIKSIRHQEIAQINRLVIYDQTGSADLYNAADVKLNTIASAFTSTSTTRTRLKMVAN